MLRRIAGAFVKREPPMSVEKSVVVVVDVSVHGEINAYEDAEAIRCEASDLETRRPEVSAELRRVADDLDSGAHSGRAGAMVWRLCRIEQSRRTSS